jgi:hypothetical protein
MMKIITRSPWYKQNVEPILSRFSWFEYQLLKRKSALSHWGWFKSRRMKSSVDAFGNQIPWYTYSFLDAISDRIPSDLRVFEYGSGNSTKWWAERTEAVVSVEHHEGWYKRVSFEMPPNVKLLYRELENNAYANAILEAGGKFDLIILDGRKRVDCSKVCVEALSDRGVIIWDNSERQKYGDGIKALLKLGFRQLRFTGFIPIDFAPSETSVFYRDGNCFGI